MANQMLYLMLGYPGAGKTTTARMLHELTGAVHLWADKERLQMFGSPTHSHDESRKLYDHLNQVVDELLEQRRSVIFDTNFSFYKDRQLLRNIAAKHGAECLIVWVATDKSIAKQRAVHDRNLRNGYELALPDDQFERIAQNIEPPRPEETTIQVDGIDLTKEKLAELIKS